MYGDLDNICMITLAPEIPNALPVIKELSKRNIKVSVGKLEMFEMYFFKWILDYIAINTLYYRIFSGFLLIYLINVISLYFRTFCSEFK